MSIRINLCCGKDYREEYLNVDFSDIASDGTEIKSDFIFDVRHKLPWDDDSVDEVLFRESLEHFNREDGYEVLKEIFRILKLGGILEVTVPNAIQQLKLLLAAASRPCSVKQWLDPHNPPWSYAKFHEDLMGATHKTLIDGKDVGQGDSHKTLYTIDLLESILQDIGFKIVDKINGSSMTFRVVKGKD